MGVSRLTVLEVGSNYPDNLTVEAYKKQDEEKWGSALYLMRNGNIHKTMLSYDDFPFDSEEEAIEKMNTTVKQIVEFYEKDGA